MKAADVIAAVATAPGRGGIGVVRVSGGALEPIVLGLLGRTLEPRRATRARFLDGEGRAIDDGIALYFPAPHSYTGEDVLELQGHGGPRVLSMLLARCVALGARPAEPGEFTRRAFENGRMDLAQAEAVADLIDAASEAAVRSAMRSLGGEFSAAIRQVRQELIDLRALVEAMLDFPEEQVDSIDRIDANDRLRGLQSRIGALIERGRAGRLLREGLRVVIAGRPNAGKSSLLNRLAGQDIAIVTPVPGTTRDTVREQLEVCGIPLHVIDTAGLRDTDDAVESIGIERAWQAIARADVLLHVVDAAAYDPSGDATLAARFPARLPRVTVFNKIDLTGEPARRESGPGGDRVWMSAATGAGLDELRSALIGVSGGHPPGEDTLMARERHLAALLRASEALNEAAQQEEAMELFAESLRRAQEAIGSITGEFTADDLLGEIFSRFCIGK